MSKAIDAITDQLPKGQMRRAAVPLAFIAMAAGLVALTAPNADFAGAQQGVTCETAGPTGPSGPSGPTGPDTTGPCPPVVSPEVLNIQQPAIQRAPATTAKKCKKAKGGKKKKGKKGAAAAACKKKGGKKKGKKK